MILPQSDTYPFKWWLMTLLVIAPLVFVIFEAVTDHFGDRGYGIIPFVVVFSLGYSFPAFLVVICFHFLMKNRKWTPRQKKMALSLVGCMTVFFTMYLTGGSEAKTFSWIYCASLLLASTVFRYKSGDHDKD